MDSHADIQGLVDQRATKAARDRESAYEAVSALDHPDPKVRAGGAFALRRMAERAEPYLPALALLLADPDAAVRQRVVSAFKRIGPVAVPLLREIRHGGRSGGRRRRTALADIGGWDALDERDQRAVERLIAVKSATEVPAPLHLCGMWYALPTTDRAAVIEAFELTSPRPVTMRLGGSAWNTDHHDWPTRVGHVTCQRVYVTPVLDGWTLVFGREPEIAHASEEEYEAALRDVVLRRCARMSEQFGAAHWYGEGRRMLALTGCGAAAPSRRGALDI